MKKLNLQYKKFGRLYALYPSTKRSANGAVKWLCKCDCGNFTFAEAGNLKAGKHRSCGCLKKENGATKRLPDGEAGFNALFKAYKDGANSRNLDFQLTKTQFRKLTKQNCAYCGTKPSQIKKSRKNSLAKPYIYNGIDRIDNLKGYSIDNCISCCGICNRMKGGMSRKEFENHIKKISLGEKYYVED